MIRSQLNSYSGADPIWGFVALIGSERYTGEAAIGIDPRVRLFAVDGHVYFAEREGDAPIGTLLVNCGAISTAQLEHGAVQVGEKSSLARLFQREPSIDRDAVELTIESVTESLLESVANKAVGMPEVFPLRHHSSGVHQWLRWGVMSTALALPVVEDVPVEEMPAAQDAPAVEGAPVEEAPVDETFAVEETSAVEEALVLEAPVVEEPFVMEEVFALETAAQLEPVIEEAPVLGAPVEEPFVMEEVFALDEAVAAEVVVEELTTSSFVTLTAMSLPTLSSLTDPVAAEVAEEDVSTGPAVAAELTAPQPLLAPMPTLASLTLPTLQSVSAPAAAPDSIVAGEPTLPSATNDVLPAPEALAPANPYEPAEPPAGLPKLASAPISMNDLAAANAVPAPPFGEPTHNLAAVDIWEMVDVLTDDGHEGEQELVGSGSSEKQSRGWLRGRKG